MRKLGIAGVLAFMALSLAGSSTTAAGYAKPTTSRIVISDEGTDHRIAGVANYRTGRTRLWANYDMTGNADLGLVPAMTPMEDIESAGVSYLKLRSCRTAACWWRIDHSAVPASVNFDQWATEDPFGLAALIKAESVTESMESVRGVQTTRYDGAIKVERVIASRSSEDRAADQERFADLETKGGGLAGVPAAVWLDGRGLPRKLQIERLGQKRTWEYYEFGVSARVALPPANDVMTSADLEAFMTKTFEDSK